MHKRPWLDVGLCTILLCGLYVARGWYLAHVCGGRYPPADMATDATVLALAIIVLRGLDHLLKLSAARIFGEQTGRRAVVSALLRGGLVFLLVAPILISLLQFCPQRQACTSTPVERGLPFEELTLQGKAGRLAAWYIPAEQPDRPVVLIAHGLGANKQQFLFAAEIVHELGYHALLFDFRAHGNSDGRVTTFGHLEAEDVKTAHDWIRSRHPDQPIFALAYSMGGAAVLRAAAKHGLFERIVLDASFADAATVSRYSVLSILGPLRTPAWHVGRFWGWVYSGIDLANHLPVQSAAQLGRKEIFFIHGTADPVISHTESLRLHEAAEAGGGRSQLWLIDGAGHIGASAHADYTDRLRRFYADLPR